MVQQLHIPELRSQNPVTKIKMNKGKAGEKELKEKFYSVKWCSATTRL